MQHFSTPSSFTTSEIAQLLGMTRQAISHMAASQKWSFELWRGLKRGNFFLLSSMPEKIRHMVLCAWDIYQKSLPSSKPDEASDQPESCIDKFLRQSEKAQERALNRFMVMLEFIALVEADMPIGKAINHVAQKYAINPANIRNWYYGINNKPGLRHINKEKWLSALVDNYAGRKKAGENISDSSESNNQIDNGE